MFIIINDEPEKFIDLKYPEIMDGVYKISSYGNVYNKFRDTIKDIKKRDKYGYVRGTFKGKDGNSVYVYIHRIVAYNFCDGYDPSSGRVFVNHKDSIRDHNYYKNLEWVTQSENNTHSFHHGFAKPHINHLMGECNGMCRYTDNFTHEICQFLDRGFTVPDIMKIYGYNKCSDNLKLYDFIRYVMRGEYRKNISSQYNFYKKVQRLSKG